MTTLNGTEKQIAWATTIKAVTLENLNEIVSKSVSKIEKLTAILEGTKSVRHSILDGDRVNEINGRLSYSGPGYHYYFTASLVTPGNRNAKWWNDVEWDFDGDGTCCGPSDF